MKVAVTGPDGQLGGQLCLELGAEAAPLPRSEMDITDRRSVLRVLGKLRPRAVINTAAYTQVDAAQHQPRQCLRVNATAVRHLAEACRRLDCPLLQVSTDYVFGADPDRGTPYRETDAPGPQGIYADSKWRGERYAAAWHKHFIVRTCGLYGVAGAARGARDFVRTMLHLAGKQRTVRVVADQRCTPSYIPHVVGAMLFLIGTTAYGTYHVTNGGSASWHEFAEEIFRLSGAGVAVNPISTAELARLAPRPAYSVLDTSKYQSLAAEPLPSWQEALAVCMTRDQTGP